MTDSLDIIEIKVKEAAASNKPIPMQGAVATFLFKVMPVDGHTHPKELERLVRILADDFSLSMEEAESLIAHAKEQGNNLETLQHMADTLKEHACRDELLTLISHMWEMVFADGKLHETEILFVERVANLLGIPEELVSQAMNIDH